jgi:uncharacterized membrane protein YhaH (DUF805 family)
MSPGSGPQGFVASVAYCLRHYATFSGRASRAEYWWFFLLTFIVQALGLFTGSSAAAVLSLVQLALVVPGTAVAVRRMHDTGHSGWWVLLPIVNLVFLLRRGDSTPNRYG